MYFIFVTEYFFNKKINLDKNFYIKFIQQNDNFFARKQEKKC